MPNTRTYTPLDLLETVLDFIRLTPDPKEWSYERQKYNDPRFVRLQQIDALLGAFIPEMKIGMDIGNSIQEFLSGDFILFRPGYLYDSLMKEMDQTIIESRFPVDEKRYFDTRALQHNYRDLLKYYIHLKKLMNHNNSVMEISYPYYFSYAVTTNISESIGVHASTLTRWLSAFIDPQEKSFTYEQLVDQYNFPEEDLTDLDIDWM